MTEARLLEKVDKIHESLTKNSGKRFAPPKIIAVTKTVAVEDILPLEKAGITHVGENRVQEIVRKAPYLNEKFQIHMIGRLQSNKVKYIIDSVCLIHSLDRVSLAKEISYQAEKRSLVMPVLVQVNMAGEAQKGGLSPTEVEDFIDEVKNFPGLLVQGLMAMMPLSGEMEELRPYFKGMRQLFDDLKEKNIPKVQMKTLSMGMSGDYPIAAQEGATMVRIGSAIFK